MTAGANSESEHSLEATVDGGTCELIYRVVAFFLAGQRYALPIGRVCEIQQIVALSEVPSGQRGVVGMVNLRGDVIPAVDMRRLVGLEARGYKLDTPMIISEVAGGRAALIVDEVQDVFELPPDCLQSAPALHHLAAEMIGVAGLADGVVFVLDLDRLLGTAVFASDAA